MAYDFYLGGVLFPLPPSALKIKINNNNKVVTLINDGDINILKNPGLTEISFTVLIPQVRYPFAVYEDGFLDAPWYLDRLELFKTSKLPYQFIVSRMLCNGKRLFDTNMKVSLEDYKLTEDVKNALDISVEISLKQYKEYGTKVADLTADGSLVFKQSRSAETAPNSQFYTVQPGDSLWTIAMSQLGAGARYSEIYTINRIMIDRDNVETGLSKHMIHPGQVLRLPER